MTAINSNLYGLILAGGHSKRMGQDKSLLTYNGKSQVQRAYDVLMPPCGRVFVSVRPEQRAMPGYAHFPHVEDLPAYSGIGPLGGMVSAMALFPDAAWLVLAADLPFVSGEVITHLIKERRAGQFATAFISTHDALPEPLCAIWEPHSRPVIETFLSQGIRCPRKILIKSNTRCIQQVHPHWLDNVNNPQEYGAAVKRVSAEAP